MSDRDDTINRPFDGDIPGFAAPFVRQLVERAPLDKLVRGGISLSNLFG